MSKTGRPCDLFYRFGTLFLTLNLLIPRFIHLGFVSFVKSLAVFAVSLSIILFSSNLKNRFNEYTIILAFIRYSIWLIFVFISVMCNYHSLLSPLVLIWLFVFMLMVDSSRVVQRITGPALAVFTMITLLLLVDIVLNLRNPQCSQLDTPDSYRMHDSHMGYRAVANFSGRSMLTCDDYPIYDVTVTTDSLSRRVAIDTLETPNEMHAIFMGCSFVFGEGVDDIETLPSHFALSTRNFAVYNYGLGGYGPQHMYYKLESGELEQEVPETSGVLVYFLHPFHIDRVVGTYIYLKWGRHTPRYILKDDQLVFSGSFADSQPFKIKLFDIIGTSRILDYVAKKIDLWLSYRYGRDPLVTIIARSNFLYDQQFNGRFIVALWPNYDDRSFDIVAGLTERNIEILDLHKEGLPFLEKEWCIPGEGHPTGSYYGIAATVLSTYIENTN